MYCETSEEKNGKYYDANEFLSEIEKETWEYGRGEREDYMVKEVNINGCNNDSTKQN